MLQKLRTETELLRFAIKAHFGRFSEKFQLISHRKVSPHLSAIGNFTPLSNVLGRPREEKEMGVTCGMSVCRLRSASTLTAKSDYLRIIEKSKIGKD